MHKIKYPSPNPFLLCTFFARLKNSLLLLTHLSIAWTCPPHLSSSFFPNQSYHPTLVFLHPCLSHDYHDRPVSQCIRNTTIICLVRTRKCCGLCMFIHTLSSFVTTSRQARFITSSIHVGSTKSLTDGCTLSKSCVVSRRIFVHSCSFRYDIVLPSLLCVPSSCSDLPVCSYVYHLSLLPMTIYWLLLPVVTSSLMFLLCSNWPLSHPLIPLIPPPHSPFPPDIARMDPPNPVTHRRTYIHTFDTAMQQHTAACASQCSAW